MPAKKTSQRRVSASGAGRLRYKVLLVDDEADHLQITADTLAREGFSTVTALGAAEGFRAAVDSHPDIAVIDVAMPGEDGRSLCRRLKSDRRLGGMPVILFSGSHVSVDDQVDGLDLGADDYLSKPVSHRLLVGKIRALLRRTRGKEDGEALAASGLKIDAERRSVQCDGAALKLTRKEFDLLIVLVRARGRVLSIPNLLESVWGYDPARYNDPATVHSHVSSLRRKLKRQGAKIVSQPGLGYRFEP